MFKLTLNEVIVIYANSHLAILFLFCLTSNADQKIEHHLGDSSFCEGVVISKACSHLVPMSAFVSHFNIVSMRTLMLTLRMGTLSILCVCVLLPLFLLFSKTQRDTLPLSVNGP